MRIKLLLLTILLGACTKNQYIMTQEEKDASNWELNQAKKIIEANKKSKRINQKHQDKLRNAPKKEVIDKSKPYMFYNNHEE